MCPLAGWKTTFSALSAFSHLQTSHFFEQQDTGGGFGWRTNSPACVRGLWQLLAWTFNDGEGQEGRTRAPGAICGRALSANTDLFCSGGDIILMDGAWVTPGRGGAAE